MKGLACRGAIGGVISDIFSSPAIDSANNKKSRYRVRDDARLGKEAEAVVVVRIYVAERSSFPLLEVDLRIPFFSARHVSIRIRSGFRRLPRNIPFSPY